LNDKTVRRRGARSLGRIGPAAEAAIPVLQAALESDDPLYRIAAAEALWRIARDERSIPLLAEYVQADDPKTAFAAAVALGELPDAGEQPLDPLAGALAHENTDVRQAAVAGLVKIGSPAIPRLSEIVADPKARGRIEAATALGMITDDLRRASLYDDAISESKFAATAVPLVRTAFPALGRALSEDDEQLRQAAALALAKGGSIAVPQLLKALTGENKNARDAAGRALVRLESYLPNQRPVPPNIQRVHRRVVGPLIAALQSEAPDVLRAGVRLFVALEIGPEGAAAAPHLRRALQTGDLATRRFADKALQRLKPQPSPETNGDGR